jgi:DNA-binding NtrC family response regulator
MNLSTLDFVEDTASQRPPFSSATRSGGPNEDAGSFEFKGRCAAVEELRRQAAEAAATISTVLIGGETGTGKGILARHIHRLSERRSAPFVHVDCTALSPSLIESELFGHERGAFTGATMRRQGRFEMAARGTIFLDEIGNIDPVIQAKLLRVLEDRQYERVGGSQTVAMTARVIAATNCDLRQAVAQGRFRADLYFRLRVVHLRVPPLRDRMSDIPTLVECALQRHSIRLGVSIPRVTNGFLCGLMQYGWPGNVRELFNLIESLLVTDRSDAWTPDILCGLLDEQAPLPSIGLAGTALPLSPVAFESPETWLPSAPTEPDVHQKEIASVLLATGGNIARAARRLNVPRSSLRYRIRQFSLDKLIPRD